MNIQKTKNIIKDKYFFIAILFYIMAFLSLYFLEGYSNEYYIFNENLELIRGNKIKLSVLIITFLFFNLGGVFFTIKLYTKRIED